MKILGALIVTLGASFVWAAPQYLELQKNSTNPAGVSVLTAHLRIQPTHPEMEIHVESTLDEESFPVTRISESKAMAITPSLENGAHEWEVKAYLQDKQIAHRYESLIAFYDRENERLAWELIEEMNPLIRAEKESERDRNSVLKAHALDFLSSHRRLLETRSLTFEVTGGSLSLFSENPVLRIEGADEVEVGQRVLMFARSLTGFEGADGPQEMVIRGDWSAGPGVLGIETSSKRVGVGAFSFVSDPLISAQVGEHVFEARLYVRSLAQSDQLRDSISDLGRRRRELIRRLTDAADPYERALCETRLTEVEKMSAALREQLESLLLQMGGPRTLTVTVIEASLAAEQGVAR